MTRSYFLPCLAYLLMPTLAILIQALDLLNIFCSASYLQDSFYKPKRFQLLANCHFCRPLQRPQLFPAAHCALLLWRVNGCEASTLGS